MAEAAATCARGVIVPNVLLPNPDYRGPKTVKKTKRKPTGAAAMGAGPGRPKGSTNKTTLQVKEMILAALDAAGGVDYLMNQATANPGPFLTLVGKVLPLQVEGPGPNGSHVFERIVREVVEPK